MTNAAAPSWVPYCGTAPDPAGWLTRWNLDPVLLVLIAALALACALHGGERRREQAGALAIFAFLFVSPFCALGSALFGVRVVHHVALAIVLAPLISGALSLDKRSILPSLTVLTAIQALVFWAWHAPPLYAAALSNDPLFWAMQSSIAGSAALWWAKLRRAEAMPAVFSLLATMMQMGFLGALLTFSGRALYAPHYLTTQAWGLSVLEDQQIAGLVMWAPGSAIYLLLACAILHREIAGRAPALQG